MFVKEQNAILAPSIYEILNEQYILLIYSIQSNFLVYSSIASKI
jgi:hypothetical protein